MGIATVVSLVFFSISLIAWGINYNKPGGLHMDVTGGVISVFLGALTALLWLRHDRKDGRSRLSAATHVVACILVWVVAIPLGFAAFSLPIQARRAETLSVPVQLVGELSGEADLEGPWRVIPDAAVTTDMWPTTKVSLRIDPGWAINHVYASITLTDGRSNHCEYGQRIRSSYSQTINTWNLTCDKVYRPSDIALVSGVTVYSK